MSELELTEALQKANSEIQSLQERLNTLEVRGKVNTLPNTNLLSESFLTRAFAVYGHSLVAGLVIVAPIYLLIFIIAMAVGGRF